MAAKPKTKAVTTWDERLAAMAAEAQAAEPASAGAFISVRGGQLTIGGNAVPGNKILAIVIDSVHENAFYVGKYDPDNVMPPKCFAFGRNDADMEPAEACAESAEHEQCKGCPNNEWGTADTGRGKACQNRRRLALILEEQLENLEDAEPLYLKLPVTSVSNWKGYVNDLATKQKRPPFSVLTEISVVPDPNTQFRVKFRCEATVDPEALDALEAKQKEVAEKIEFPYTSYEDALATAKPAAAATRRGAVTRRR